MDLAELGEGPVRVDAQWAVWFGPMDDTEVSPASPRGLDSVCYRMVPKGPDYSHSIVPGGLDVTS